MIELLGVELDDNADSGGISRVSSGKSSGSVTCGGVKRQKNLENLEKNLENQKNQQAVSCTRKDT